MKTAHEIMTPDPTSLKPSASISDAIALLRELDIRHVPIVNDDREVVGILSDRDLRGLALAQPNDEWSPGRLDVPVSQVMSTDVLAVELDTGADEIVDLMLEYKIGAVPVVNAENQLTGIVSYIDLLRSLRSAVVEDRLDTH